MRRTRYLLLVLPLLLTCAGCGLPTYMEGLLDEAADALDDAFGGSSDGWGDGSSTGCGSLELNLIMEQSVQACHDCQIWFWGMGVPEQRPRLEVQYSDSSGSYSATFHAGNLATHGDLLSTRVLAESPWWGPGSCDGDVSCAADYLHHFAARGTVGGSPLWHGLIYSDLSLIPCDATIDQAQLHLHINEDEGLDDSDDTSVVSFYRGTKTWDPRFVNGQRYSNDPETGQDLLWDTPGGDFGEFVLDLEVQRDLWDRGFNKDNPAAWFDLTAHVSTLQGERATGGGTVPGGDGIDCPSDPTNPAVWAEQSYTDAVYSPRSNWVLDCRAYAYTATGAEHEDCDSEYQAGGGRTGTATFTFNNVPPGEYDVYVGGAHTENRNPAGATFLVNGNPAVINQRSSGGSEMKWDAHGTWCLADTVTVVLDSNNSGSDSVSGVRLIPTPDDSGSSSGGSGGSSSGGSGGSSSGGSGGSTFGGTPSGDPPAELTGADVIWLQNMDVTDWPVTASLNSVTFVGGQISLNYDKRDEWPSTYVSSPAGDPVEVVANAWVIAEHEGQWYGKTWEWMRPGQHYKSRFSVNGDHTGSWPFAPGDSFLPTPGVTYFFMVSTPARYGSIMTIAERSNLVPIVWN